MLRFKMYSIVYDIIHCNTIYNDIVFCYITLYYSTQITLYEIKFDYIVLYYIISHIKCFMILDYIKLYYNMFCQTPLDYITT